MPGRSGLIDEGGSDMAAVGRIGVDVDKGRFVGGATPSEAETGKEVVAREDHIGRLHVEGVAEESSAEMVACAQFDKGRATLTELASI